MKIGGRHILSLIKAFYCYNVMSFELKNTCSTFQKMINKVFIELIGYNVEAYVTDIVVNSEKAEEYIKDLEEVFDMLRKFWVKFNP